MDLQALYDQACAIRDAAASEQRDLTAAEVARLDQLLDQFDSTAPLARLDQLAQSRGRQTMPDVPGAGPMGNNRRDDERLVDAHGREVRVLAQAERLADLTPRSEQLPLSDLGGIAFAAATGDFSRISDRCRSIMAQQGGQTDASGNVLIPTPLSASVIDAVRAASVVMRAPGIQTIPMPSRTLDIARVLTPPTAAWRVEHEVIAESTVVLDRVQLTARSLGCSVRTSLELLDDSPMAGNLLRDQIAQTMAQALDSALLTGAGGTAPLGLVTMAMQSPQTGVQSVLSVGTPADYSAWVEAFGLLWGIDAEPTSVLLGARTRTVLVGLDTGVDTTAVRKPRDLDQVPWLVTSKLDVAGSPQESYSVVADFNQVAVGMRQEVRLQVTDAGGTYTDQELGLNDTGDAWDRNQLRLRATLRCDLAVFQPSKVVVMMGINA